MSVNLANDSSQGWQLIRVTLPAQQQDAVSELLISAGASAITLEGPADDPLFEPIKPNAAFILPLPDKILSLIDGLFFKRLNGS